MRFFFRGASGASGIHLFSVISFIACTCPNRSGVGVIDNLDRSEKVFDQYNIPEASEKIFTHDLSMVCRLKKETHTCRSENILPKTFFDTQNTTASHTVLYWMKIQI